MAGEEHAETPISCGGKDCTAQKIVLLFHSFVLVPKIMASSEPFYKEVNEGCVYANKAAKCNSTFSFSMKFQLGFRLLTQPLNTSKMRNFCSFIGVAAHTALHNIKLLHVCDISFVAFAVTFIFHPVQCM